MGVPHIPRGSEVGLDPAGQAPVSHLCILVDSKSTVRGRPMGGVLPRGVLLGDCRCEGEGRSGGKTFIIITIVFDK